MFGRHALSMEVAVLLFMGAATLLFMGAAGLLLLEAAMLLLFMEEAPEVPFMATTL